MKVYDLLIYLNEDDHPDYPELDWREYKNLNLYFTQEEISEGFKKLKKLQPWFYYCLNNKENLLEYRGFYCSCIKLSKKEVFKDLPESGIGWLYSEIYRPNHVYQIELFKRNKNYSIENNIFSEEFILVDYGYIEANSKKYALDKIIKSYYNNLNK